MNEQALCRFRYSTDGKESHATGEEFAAKPGRWIGAKVGLFATRSGVTLENGYADYDWFRVEKQTLSGARRQIVGGRTMRFPPARGRTQVAANP